MCGLAGEYRYQATPEAADAGPATGTGGDIKLTFKSGTRHLSHDDFRNVDKIQEIHLYESDMTCDMSSSGAKGAQVTLFVPGGATTASAPLA